MRATVGRDHGPGALAPRPLVVDLDGTLVSTDMLVESASAVVTSQPFESVHLLSWLRAGKAQLKHELASRAPIDAATLPYRSEVLDWLRAEHAGGRQLVLASASDERIVRQVAEHLGIFDEAYGSAPDFNCRSSAKRDLLVRTYGDRGYDYVGDHRHDLPIWASGRTAHVVGNERLVAKAAGVSDVGRTFAPARLNLRALVRAVRPHQWLKNILVALPLLTSHRLGDGGSVWVTVVAVVAFTLVAASVYVLNDLADVTHDRRHPVKRQRPFASGELSIATGWLLWPLLAMAGCALAAVLLPWEFVVVLAGYLLSTLAYTFWLKGKAIGDVMLLGCLYTVRVIAGAVAIDVPLSLWLLTFSMLFFLSLALVKRVSELMRLREESDGEWTTTNGRGYRSGDLELLSSFGVASSIGAVVVFSLYVQAPTTIAMYATPWLLWLTVPVLLTWLMRVWLLAHRGEMNEDPLMFAAGDWRSLVAGAAIVASFAAASGLAL